MAAERKRVREQEMEEQRQKRMRVGCGHGGQIARTETRGTATPRWILAWMLWLDLDQYGQDFEGCCTCE